MKVNPAKGTQKVEINYNMSFIAREASEKI